MGSKYLDLTGLAHFWEKIKTYVQNNRTSVAVTQTVSSGTKIGSISVDGTSTDLYAPSGGSSAVSYVTEEGTKGTSVIWHYRKWSTGKIEAWCTYEFASTSSSVWTSPIRYWDKTISIPSGLFTAAPKMIAGSDSNQYWVCDAHASSSTSASSRVLTVATSSMAITLRIYAWYDPAS